MPWAGFWIGASALICTMIMVSTFRGTIAKELIKTQQYKAAFCVLDTSIEMKYCRDYLTSR